MSQARRYESYQKTNDLSKNIQNYNTERSIFIEFRCIDGFGRLSYTKKSTSFP